MTRVIRIPSASFTQPGLPVVKTFAERIMAIPLLRAWFNGLPETVYRNEENRLVSWRDRSGNDTAFIKVDNAAAQRPLFVPAAYSQRNALRFTKARGDALRWSGQRSIGNNIHTSIIIANFSPQTTTPQQLLSDITPNTGWNAMYVQKDGGGATNLLISTGDSGSVGKATSITNYVSTGRPMLIIAVVDPFYNAIKTKINNQPVSVSNVTPVIQASDVYIGASGYEPDTLAGLGIDMDLFELIMMNGDLLGDGYQTHLQSVLDYAKAAYGII